MNLYAQLQINPRNIVIYREIAEYYRKNNKVNEAEAFIELIRKKFHANDSSIDKKQFTDHSKNP
jgi:hypothetical protein